MDSKKTVGIAGLGLIGGSLAKAIKAYTPHTLYGADLNRQTLESAIADKTIDYELNVENIADCDIVIIALYTGAVIDFFKARAERFKKGALIIDCAGVKGRVCREISKTAAERGLRFVGGHPMAGRAESGFAFSSAELFGGATMILCKDGAEEEALQAAGDFFLSLGFGHINITTAAEHDEVIAFTSQLAHIASNAFVKSPAAKKERGFSAGSFKDLTRVAKLNEAMWTELFFENGENLLREIKGLQGRLGEYAVALENKDAELMKKLLSEGTSAKLALDKVAREGGAENGNNQG